MIVVDDCSTDKTVEIVEGYKEKFNGRLRLIKSEKNSGHPGEPRNKGIALSCNEYIYCLDSDDIILETALEEMYSQAKAFNADVVYCEKYFMSEGFGQEFRDKIHIADSRIQKPPFVDKPTLETEDLSERLKKLFNVNYWMSPALRLVRKSLLIDNDITFPNLVGSEDDIWSLKILFSAKKFLRIPNACFVRRIHEEGISFSQYTTPDHVQRWMDATIRSLKDLDNFLKGIEFFRENPARRFELVNRSVKAGFSNIFKRCENESAFNIYNIFLEKFGDIMGEHDVLISCLCSLINEQRKSHNKRQQKSEQDFKKQLAAQDKEISRLKAELEFMTPLPALPTGVPAVSVIIPMYNSEEFIGECLDSLVAQTFQNFEVIIVDDCSTDNSVAIAASYIPKFSGRLKITKTEKNSGGGGVPRNVGINLARGEYILFVDSDDFILTTALETLHKAAREYDAEAVYTPAYYFVANPNDVYLRRDSFGKNLIKENKEDKIDFTVNNPKENLRRLFFKEGDGNFHGIHSRLIRRDFLIENKIFFPNVSLGEDFLWLIKIYCHAKRFLRIPTPFYFYRYNTKSVSRANKEPYEQISHWIPDFINWSAALNDLEKSTEILRENPSYCLAAAKSHFKWCLYCTEEAREKLTSQEIYELLCTELAAKNDSANMILPFFFSVIDENQKELENTNQIIKRIDKYIAARIDIKLATNDKTGDFKIVSTTDNRATTQKPTWLQKDGIGYVIHSFVGKMEFVVKASVDGKITLTLRGADIRNPEDKTKRIPYWIDYTKLIVNGATIFDELTPVWHNKPYRYNMGAKADEEIKIQVEWLPHRSDT